MPEHRIDKPSARACTVTGIFILLAGLQVAASSDLITSAMGRSVHPGLWLRSSPERATYVSFCLNVQHHEQTWYPMLCSQDHPEQPYNLKRIARRLPDGRLIVQGDSKRALDSRFLGPIEIEDVQGWWVRVAKW